MNGNDAKENGTRQVKILQLMNAIIGPQNLSTVEKKLNSFVK